MATLSIHINRKATGILKLPCILLSYHLPDEYLTLLRMLRHRKVEEQFVAERFATQEERDNESHPYRTGFLVYSNWDKLIRDEQKYCEEPNWLQTLETLKLRYPQFNTLTEPNTK